LAPGAGNWAMEEPWLLSITMWAFATMRLKPDQAVLNTAALIVGAQIHSFKSFEASNVLWAFAKMRVPHSILFSAGAQAVVDNPQRYSTQCLSIIAWSFATVRLHHQELLGVIASEMARNRGDCKAQEISNTLWAFATLSRFDITLFRELGDEASTKLETFKPQELSNTVWSFAVTGMKAPALFRAAADAAEAMASSMEPQNLANFLWAFAKARLRCPALCTLLGECLRKLPSFKPQEISSTLWAVAKLQLHHCVPFCSQVQEGIVDRLPEFSPQALANTVWACVQTRTLKPSFFHAVARAASERIREFEPLSLCNLLQAVGALTAARPLPENGAELGLAQLVLSVVAERLSTFRAQELAKLVLGLRELCATHHPEYVEAMWTALHIATRKSSKMGLPELIEVAATAAELLLPAFPLYEVFVSRVLANGRVLRQRERWSVLACLQGILSMPGVPKELADMAYLALANMHESVVATPMRMINANTVMEHETEAGETTGKTTDLATLLEKSMQDSREAACSAGDTDSGSASGGADSFAASKRCFSDGSAMGLETPMVWEGQRVVVKRLADDAVPAQTNRLHTNTIGVIGEIMRGSEDSNRLLVMPFYSNGSLLDVLQSAKPLSVAEILHIMQGLVNGLLDLPKAARKRPLGSRVLNPSKILLDEHLNPQLQPQMCTGRNAGELSARWDLCDSGSGSRANDSEGSGTAGSDAGEGNSPVASGYTQQYRGALSSTESATSSTTPATTATPPGTVSAGMEGDSSQGWLKWLAPEMAGRQWAGDELAAKTLDAAKLNPQYVYCLGLLLYCMLIHAPDPYENLPVEAVWDNLVNEKQDLREFVRPRLESIKTARSGEVIEILVDLMQQCWSPVADSRLTLLQVHHELKTLEQALSHPSTGATALEQQVAAGEESRQTDMWAALFPREAAREGSRAHVDLFTERDDLPLPIRGTFINFPGGARMARVGSARVRTQSL